MNEPPPRERFRGCIVGLAVGDALGYPHEFRSVEQVRRELGPDGITDYVALKDRRFSRPIILGPDLPPGSFTDDTQMSLAICEALLASWKSEEELFEQMAAAFVRWHRSPENNRSPGATCGTACDRLAKGIPWQNAGVSDSKGCGANMRVAPLGLFFSSYEQLHRVARTQSKITHGHSTALASSAATALAVRFSFEGDAPRVVLDRVQAYVRGEDATLDKILEETKRALDEPPEKVLVDRSNGPPALGEGWVAEEALASALYCAARTPDDFRKGVLLAVNTDGDSDSIASIAGALLGARLGLSAIPEAWVRELERAEELIAIADRLYDARLQNL